MILTTSIPRSLVLEMSQDHITRETNQLKRRMLREVAERMHREFVCIETTVTQDYERCLIECRALFFPRGTTGVEFDEPTPEWTIYFPPAEAQQPANNAMRGIEL